jgi:hypothetical protein
MNGIADALGALPVAERDAVTVRRQRQQLLATFNDAQLVSHRWRTSHRRLAGAVVVAAVAALVALAAVRGRRLTASAVVAKTANHAGDVVVVAPDGSRWSRAEDEAMTRVSLEEGELSIHVKHHGDTHHLFVALPDGELEDVGTTFRVQVHDGRTIAIRVREGAIVFRRARAGAVWLGAGESWLADEASAEAVIPALGGSGASGGTPRGLPPPKASSVSNAQGVGGRDTKEFRDAVDLLNAGNAAGAAAAFRAYLGRKPASDRAEDATYLLVLALRRSGDEAGASAAARDYLRLYPHGLRRREIEGFAPAAPANP